MELTINLRLTADAALLAALQALTSCLTTTGKPEPVPVGTARSDKNAPETDPGQVAKAPEAAAEEVPEPQPAGPAKAAQAMPTTQDVRSAMEATRARLEYPDGKETRDEERHRKLTDAFKKIAAEIGGTKPSQLPEEKRQAFIDRVTELDADCFKNDLPF